LTAGISSEGGLSTWLEVGGSSVNLVHQENAIGSEAINSRTTVAQLSAMFREQEATYFITHTVNQKQHFGLSPIRNWLGDLCESVHMKFGRDPS
jgi:hypothetical protein